MTITAGLSESAARNYELGNRTASQDQLEKIANALKISPFILAAPNFNTYISVIHSFFAFEVEYGSIESEILLFLSTHTASTNEIANHLNISRASTVRKLQSLQNLNLIEKSGANKQLKWKVK